MIVLESDDVTGAPKRDAMDLMVSSCRSRKKTVYSGSSDSLQLLWMSRSGAPSAYLFSKIIKFVYYFPSSFDSIFHPQIFIFVTEKCPVVFTQDLCIILFIV